MKCNANNSCMGGYGKCLDVKITNQCNAKCKFCIERDGYSPTQTNVKELIENTVSLNDYENVLILGGEPLLYDKLEEYLQGIKPYKKAIYITTNGSLLDVEKATMLSKYLTAINISIHHFSEFLNDKIYGTHVSLNRIKSSIKVFNEFGVKVRVNCNLVKGILDNKSDAETMIEFVNSIGADEIRFSELQNAEEQYVDASEIFDNITNNPFCDGCEQLLVGYPINVRVKITCGIVNKLKKQIVRDEAPKYDTKVLYPNSEISNGWKSRIHNDGCHQVVRGCH